IASSSSSRFFSSSATRASTATRCSLVAWAKARDASRTLRPWAANGLVIVQWYRRWLDATQQHQVVAMYHHVIALVERLGIDPHQTLSHHFTLGSVDLDGVTLVELATERLHTHAQQAATVVFEGLEGTLVDAQLPRGSDRKGDPGLARGQAFRPGLECRTEVVRAAEGSLHG